MRINENNFIDQLGKKNEDALMYVIDTYGRLIMSIIGKHLYHLPDCQGECFNDVLLGIWDHMDSFDGEQSSFKNWIAAVTRYKAVDYLRKYRRDMDTVNLEDVVLVEENDLLMELLDKEISEETENMLACLNPMDREIFMEIYFREERPEKVGEKIGISKSAVYNHLSRGKKKIRKNHTKT